MSTKRLSIAVLGSGTLADTLAQQIKADPALALSCTVTDPRQLTASAVCVAYLPTAEVSLTQASEQIQALLTEGRNVVTSLPASALGKAAILSACKQGKSTFHGSGGFQNALPVRFNRAFAAITRDISDIALVEERSVSREVAHNDISNSTYQDSLHTLSEAVFGNRKDDVALDTQHIALEPNANPPRIGGISGAEPHTVIRRSLGKHASYDSLWSDPGDGRTALRYHLHTRSADAVGHATITLDGDGQQDPSCYLESRLLHAALAANVHSAPGILHHELDINAVKADDRL
mgnify:CR=1 FL=1